MSSGRPGSPPRHRKAGPHDHSTRTRTSEGVLLRSAVAGIALRCQAPGAPTLRPYALRRKLTEEIEMSYAGIRRTSRALTFGRLALMVALSCGAARSWAQGVDNNAVFELDGNTQDNAPAGLDWESVFPPNTPITLNPIQDPAPLTVYTTGGSKDTNDVSQWRHKSGS